MAVIKEITIPDIGDFKSVDVLEILVSVGDSVKVEDSLITVESDKATLDIPAPYAGVVKEIKLKVGDKISKGDLLLLLEVNESATEKTDTEKSVAAPASVSAPVANNTDIPTKIEAPKPASTHPNGPSAAPLAPINDGRFRKAHASPSVRRFARELGADLGLIQGRGPKGRILKEDVQSYIKQVLSRSTGGQPGLYVAELPDIDFTKFGETEILPLTKINKLTGRFLHRSWFYVPHVTQFDEADVTDLEQFRKDLNKEYASKDVKITVVAFLIKAVVSALKEYPRFNSSLDNAQENIILKKYYNVGVAVDTPEGLVVPVFKDVDRKSLGELAKELSEVAERARARKLAPHELQGACFTISSLGGVGGTAFTPIVNQPEVAILGVSRADIKPVFQEGVFVPRLILPLSLSYDHRVIDGAQAARFTTYLGKVLSDARRLVL
ncbi:MAG: dihydrolipoyllysine-residue acetyltransferase [Gammaproteobacteria bacterium]|nr:dihydrolipoyllysine-residue acetyltransferase [Gammaproteobacteria bacterium]